MDAFLNSFLSTLGVLAACGVCAAIFAIVDLIYETMKSGLSCLDVWHGSFASHEWQYEEFKKKVTERNE
jgi:hypothetical protein